MSKPAVESKAYTRQQFADAYGRSLSRVKQLIASGEVAVRKDGASTLIDVAEAERWFASLPTSGDAS